MCEILLPSLFLCSCTTLRPTAIPPTAAPRPRLHQAAFGVGSALVDDVREYDAQTAAIRNAAAAHIRKQPPQPQPTATAVANPSAAEAASGSSSFDGLVDCESLCLCRRLPRALIIIIIIVIVVRSEICIGQCVVGRQLVRRASVRRNSFVI